MISRWPITISAPLLVGIPVLIVDKSYEEYVYPGVKPGYCFVNA